MKKNQILRNAVYALFLTVIIFTIIQCAGTAGKGYSLSVQVVSKDENSKALIGAKVRMVRDKESRVFSTVEGGRATLDPLYKLPFKLIVTYDEDNSYLPKEIEISETDFTDRTSLLKEIQLEKKKTIISGMVIDKLTKKPISVVTVEIRPKVTFVQTDTLGMFRVESANIKENLTYTMKLVREKPVENRRYKDYEKNLDNLRIYGKNDIGIIEMDSYEIEADDLNTSGEIQLRSQSQSEPTYE